MDRASELWATPDLWREIRPRILEAANDAAGAAMTFALDLDDYSGPVIEAEMRHKFLAGEQEHGRDWLQMSRSELEQEIRYELMDLVLYHAMILARWETVSSTPPFESNTDPGDEQA